MPRESTSLPCGGFALDRESPVPLYQQLYEQIRAGIESGQLQPGLRLPATRSLAQELQVSRNTVLVAYEQLVTERFANSQVGSGTRVAARSHRVAAVGPRTVTRLPVPPVTARPVPRLSRATHGMLRAARAYGVRHQTASPVAQPFVLGVPALDLFPTGLWSRVLSRRAARLNSSELTHQDPAGYWPLRKELAAYLGLARGVKCTAEQVLIASSTQVLTNLLARILLEPGEQALVEDPGYPGIRTALSVAGVAPCPVDVDHEGLCIALGEKRHPGARLAVVTPNNQFPLGVRMSSSRRGQLLEWAGRVNGWLIEDDYDGEFWSDTPSPPLQQMDEADHVVYVGTLSKALFPALRMAYAVVPPDLVDPVTAAQRVTTGALPVLEQAAVLDFIREDHFARHIRRMRQAYIERREGCVAALRGRLGGLVRLTGAAAGMHLVATLPAGTDDSRVAALCSESRTTVYPLSSYYAETGAPVPGLVLGYGATPPAQAALGARHIAGAVARATRVAV
ncbi:PLP-dependent aminotransferase family protein [Streptomyces ossamyceticus]|nr:PLP-dependent aminotransferase family protein [Streptomyces ossamyceticus]